jgi:hypothetical protein
VAVDASVEDVNLFAVLDKGIGINGRREIDYASLGIDVLGGRKPRRYRNADEQQFEAK